MVNKYRTEKEYIIKSIIENGIYRLKEKENSNYQYFLMYHPYTPILPINANINLILNGPNGEEIIKTHCSIRESKYGIKFEDLRCK